MAPLERPGAALMGNGEGVAGERNKGRNEDG
jgi:hypothetical protein